MKSTGTPIASIGAMGCTRWLSIVSLAAVLAACEGSVSGSMGVFDAGPRSDDAGPTLADAGPPGAFDAGARRTVDAGPATGWDAGRAGDAGRPPEPSACGELAGCGACGADAGCSFCAATGTCARAGSACAFGAGSGADACRGPEAPCTVASCWDPSTTLPRCGSSTLDEDFSSGRYAVHRFSARVEPGGPVDLRLERRAGAFAPALFVTDAAGRLVHAGATATLHPDVDVLASTDGRAGAVASVTLEARAGTDLRIHVTGWEVVDGGFRGLLPTSARYSLSLSQRCPPGMGGVHAGIDMDGNHVPRAGLANRTLEGALGVAVEPYGDVVTVEGRPWVSGLVSWFGGPADTGVTSTETGAITGERLRSLNDPLDASAAEIASRPEDFYFVAMRWDYSPGGRSFWRDARLVVRNPATGREVVVRPVDWGPNTRTRRILDLSPQSLEDLGLHTDDTAQVAFAAPGTPLGVVP